MSKLVITLLIIGLVLMLGVTAMSATVKLQLSGPGKVNDSTIKAGQKVTVDVYLDNEKTRMGFSIGLKISSPDKSIATIQHPADSGKGYEESNGDIKGYNGFESKAIFDLLCRPVLQDWDGKLPDLLGFVSMVFKKQWNVMPMQKCYSFDLIVPNAGSLRVDSSFFPPGGRWLFVSGPTDETIPKWMGPYKYTVVK
jgi:hypothetical protein